MRIGLARHFRVQEPWPAGRVTLAELLAWRRRYDQAAVCPVPVEDQSARWSRCYASDLPRAVATAEAMYAGGIILHAGLREAEFAALPGLHGRFPVWVWRILIRVAWTAGHSSQRSLRDDFVRRVSAVADVIEAQAESALVVSHAGTMIYLRKELARRGFHGPKFGVAEHARVYEFERPDRSAVLAGVSTG